MVKKIDMSGMKFNRITVVSISKSPENSSNTGLYWNCLCDCGNEFIAYGSRIRNGSTKSCGCLKRELNSLSMKKMRLNMSGTINDRFFSRFKIDEKSGCWNWTAHRDKDGYGFLPGDNSNIRAHRYSYAYHYGEDISGILVCHKCDNPGCVNPDHLFIGNAKDNVTDMISKGRDMMIGSRNNKAKLNEYDVAEIRKSTLSTNDLSKKYKVSKSSIKRILTRKNWDHVK